MFFTSLAKIVFFSSPKMIKALNIDGKFREKYSWGSIFCPFMPLLKVLQNVNATAGQYFFPHLNNYFRFFVINNRISYVSHFFPLLLWNSEFLYESAVVSLPICHDSFWDAMAFTEQRCLFSICGFLLTQYCEQKRTRTVFYWNAGGVYWSAVAFTDPLVKITGPRCRLLIR